MRMVTSALFIKWASLSIFASMTKTTIYKNPKAKSQNRQKSYFDELILKIGYFD